MYIMLKGLCLFFTIITMMPLMFFVLVGSCGRYFVLRVDRESWLARTRIKWIRVIADRFLV